MLNCTLIVTAGAPAPVPAGSVVVQTELFSDGTIALAWSAASPCQTAVGVGVASAEPQALVFSELSAPEEPTPPDCTQFSGLATAGTRSRHFKHCLLCPLWIALMALSYTDLQCGFREGLDPAGATLCSDGARRGIPVCDACGSHPASLFAAGGAVCWDGGSAAAGGDRRQRRRSGSGRSATAARKAPRPAPLHGPSQQAHPIRTSNNMK